MLINELPLVFQQPATDESFPIKFKEFLMVFLMIYFDFENIALWPIIQYGPCHEALKATVKCQYFLRKSVTMIFPCVNWDNNTKEFIFFLYKEIDDLL